MTQNLVEFRDVSMRYGTSDHTLALHHATFQVKEGEFVAVVGPSGCGKSSLMKTVSGLKMISGGEMEVDGKAVNGPLSFVGMAFQSPNLLPWRSVLDNVMLPLEIVQPHARQLSRNRAAYRQKALALIELVGLKGYENAFPWELSGGMQQRCQLCRALVHEPRLLMLDEPFGALDMFTREELWVALQDLWLERKPTVILVTHDLREAVYLADRVLVMSSRPGRIIYERDVPTPRRRSLDTTYEAEPVRIVHELRDHISAARQAA